MLVWLMPILIKYVFPAIINILQKTGFINAAEAWAVKHAEAIKIYKDQFPTGKGGRSSG